MDIGKELDSLILEYGIDRYHSKFKVKLESERAIRDFEKEHSGKKWIVIAKAPIDARAFFAEVDFSQVRQTVLYQETTDETLAMLREAQKEDLILIVSFHKRNRMRERLLKAGIRAFCLYDYFALKGVPIWGDFYDIFGEGFLFNPKEELADAPLDMNYQDSNYVFFHDRRGYECAEAKEYKQIYLARMIFDSAYFRDIEGMTQYIKKYAEERYDGFERYLSFLAEVDHLISEIKERLSLRRQKDIILFWLDALEYGDDQSMPWLSSMSERGLEFTRAYTVTPYTHSTARTLFHQKYTVDDRIFNEKMGRSCKLASMLEGKGYKVEFHTYLSEVDFDIKSKFPQNEYMPLPQICWECLRGLLKSDGPVFSMLHELFHTHPSYVSPGITGSEYLSSAFGNTVDGTDYTAQKDQSRKYTDRILKYYTGLLNEHTFKIYMSDHGHTYFDKFHTILRVIQKDIRPQRIDGIFSYISFGRLIEKLIDGDTDYRDIISQYAKIQDTDFYNRGILKGIVTQRPQVLPYFFGYEGIVTDHGYYLRYHDGPEEYYNLNPGEPVAQEWVEEAASLCPDYPDDILADDKFKYSRNLYNTMNRYLKRNHGFEEVKLKTVMDIFEQIPEDAVVALRGGGKHTYCLWLALPWRLRKKISFMIDRNPQCMASRTGVPVISLDQLREKGVSHVVISSFDYEAEWLEELQNMAGDFKIVPFYEELKSRGVACKYAFYQMEFCKEDIVWEE